MPNVTFVFSQNHIDRVQAAIPIRYGYRAILDDGTPNPESVAKFCRRIWLEMLIAAVQEHERNTARAAVTEPEQLIATY